MSVIRYITVSVAFMAVILVFNANISARKNPFSGILPPQNSAVDINQRMMEPTTPPEEVQPVYPQIHLVINIAERTATLFNDGKEVMRRNIAVGQPIYKTPAGAQSIDTIIWNPDWTPPDSPWAKDEKYAPPGPRNPLGPVKLMMGDGIRLHGTTKAGSIGLYASHGCLRMNNEEVAEFAWYIQKNINNADESLFEKYKKNRSTTYWVKLDYPVSVEIIYQPVVIREGVVTIHNDAYRWSGNAASEVMKALIDSSIDVKKVDMEKVDEIEFPKKKYDVQEIRIEDLLLK